MTLRATWNDQTLQERSAIIPDVIEIRQIGDEIYITQENEKPKPLTKAVKELKIINIY